jgi:serine/threonine protein kinase
MLKVKQRLGDFEIIRLLGKGGIGEVYEAQQSHPPRRVALKVLVPWLAEDEEALARFWREAEVPAQLDHPGIVKIITTGKSDGLAFYTMHLVRGVSLAGLIRQAASNRVSGVYTAVTTPETPRPEGANTDLPAQPGPFPVGDVPPAIGEAYQRDRQGFVVRVGAAAARVLASAHERGFVHRDVKPSNLMIDHHGQVYVVDFGLTAALDAPSEQSSAGGFRGTPLYASPEQARGERGDCRADVYALGVTLYELITGGIGPYSADRSSREEVLSQVRSGSVVPLRSQAPGVSAALERVVAKALHPDPRRRYQDAGELADALERLGAGSGIVLPSRERKPLGRLSRAVGLVLLLLAVGAGAMAWKGPLWPGSAPVRSAEEATPSPAEKAGVGEGPPYPKQRLERRWGDPLMLLRNDFLPTWHRRLMGKGTYSTAPGQGLVLNSVRSQEIDEQITLLALDDDPLRRWFEFTVEMQKGTGDNNLGAFFGWRPQSADPDTPSFYFRVSLDDKPREPGAGGVCHVYVERIWRGKAGRGGGWDYGELPWDRGRIELPALGGWHSLLIRARDNGVTIAMDGIETFFDSAFLHRDVAPMFPDARGDFDPRGALGVWIENGQGYFRNATITPLPATEQGR